MTCNTGNVISLVLREKTKGFGEKFCLSSAYRVKDKKMILL